MSSYFCRSNFNNNKLEDYIKLEYNVSGLFLR